jgi:retinol dehydrogenase-12
MLVLVFAHAPCRIRVIHTNNTCYKRKHQLTTTKRRYSTSKLLEVFSIRVLGDLETSRISSSKDSSTNSSCGPRPQVIINCMTPGACMSDFFRENPPGLMKSIGDFFSGMIARTAEQGSRALVAGLEADRESQGAYMDCCVVAK